MNAEFKIKGKELETDRLMLRPFKGADLSDFYEYASVDGVGEMAGWTHHESIEKTEEILNMFIKEDKVFALVCKENSRVIGSLGVEEYGMEDNLSEFDLLRGREIGYVLSKDYWGQGIMPEAVMAVTEYLFSQMNLDFLLCGYFLFNSRSKRVQEKCGFKPYRSVVMNTDIGTEEKGVLSLLTNPNKQIRLEFSHPETLIYEG